MPSSSADAAAADGPRRWLAAFDRRTGIYTTLVFAWFELRKAHAGSAGGMLWTVLVPLIQCLIYVFIFVVVLDVRFEIRPGVPGGPAEYTVFILSGLVPWMLANTTIAGGTDMVQQYAAFIRQPNFPYRIIPTVIVLLAIPGHIAGVAVLAVGLAMVDLGFGGPAWLFLLAAYVCAFFALRGVATVLGLLTMYARDMRHVITLAMSFLIYLSPVFYSPAQVPARLHFLLYVNPFAYALACFKYGYTGDPAQSVLGPGIDLIVLAGLAVVGWLVQRAALGGFRAWGIDSVG